MGCDIHVMKEKKVDGKWISLDKWVTEDEVEYPHLERSLFNHDNNYRFFAALAGVRDYQDGINRIHYSSLPRDISNEVMTYYVRYWGIDAHSPGCITKDQAIKLMQDLNPCPTCNHIKSKELSKDVIDRFKDIIDNLEEDERCVFWFDN